MVLQKENSKAMGFLVLSQQEGMDDKQDFATAMEVLNAEFREGIHAMMLLDNFSGHK